MLGQERELEPEEEAWEPAEEGPELEEEQEQEQELRAAEGRVRVAVAVVPVPPWAEPVVE